jgi:hypothetical protein
MSAPPDPEMRRAPGQGRPVVALGRKKQSRRYIISDDLQALAIALSPLWLAILLAIYLRGSQ